MTISFFSGGLHRLTEPGRFWRLVLLIVSVISLGILYSPLLGLMLSVLSDGSIDLQSSVFPLVSISTLILLIKTVFLASSSVILAMIIAFGAGSWIWMRNGTAIEKIRWVVILAIPLPLYIQALTWSTVVSDIVSGQSLLGMTISSLQGWAISIWVQAIAMLPLAVGVVILSLDLLDMRLIDAARTFQSDWSVMKEIIFPLTAPFLLCGAGILFVLAVTEYTIPSLFSVTVYSLGLFSAFSATNNPLLALLLSLPLLAITLAIIVWAAYRLSATFQEQSLHSYLPAAKFSLPSSFTTAQSVAFLLFIVDIALTLGILSVQAVTGKGSLVSLSGSAGDIVYSLEIAIWVALVSIPLACILGWNLYSGKKRLIWWILVIAPLAVPAPLIGIGLIGIGSVFPGYVVSDSILLPVLASVTRFIPFAALLTFAQWKRIDPLLIDAGYVFGKSRWDIARRIELPLLLPGLLAASGLMAVLSLCELGATLLVIPPGSSTVTIRVYNYLHYGSSGSVAALCLVMAGLVVGITVIVLALLSRKWEEIGRWDKHKRTDP